MKRFVLFLLVLFSATAHGQGYADTDFWICFPQNALYEAGGSPLDQHVYLTSEYRSTGYIQAQNDSSRIPFALEYGTSMSIAIDSIYEVVSSGTIERKSLHVVSDQPVSVFVVSHRKASTDSYMAIPTHLLGKEYIVAGYTNNPNVILDALTSQAEIIASEDNTLVAI